MIKSCFPHEAEPILSSIQLHDSMSLLLTEQSDTYFVKSKDGLFKQIDHMMNLFTTGESIL